MQVDVSVPFPFRRTCPWNSPLINSIAGRPLKNDEMQGGRILRNEAYNQYAARTKDESQRRRSRFSTA